MKTVFFDLDGTLTDPKDGITRSIRSALERMDRDAPPEDELTWCIGPPLLGSFETLVGVEDAPRALALFRERFSETGWRENTPYPGVHAALDRLREAGLTLHVATSKPAVYAQRILDHFELSPHFGQVFGSELDGTRSDKTTLLAFALDQSGADAATSAMVGDRRHDVAGARANGIESIGVTWGYGTADELRDAGAHHVVSSYEELIRWVT